MSIGLVVIWTGDPCLDIVPSLEVTLILGIVRSQMLVRWLHSIAEAKYRALWLIQPLKCCGLVHFLISPFVSLLLRRCLVIIKLLTLLRTIMYPMSILSRGWLSFYFGFIAEERHHHETSLMFVQDQLGDILTKPLACSSSTSFPSSWACLISMIQLEGAS